MKEFVNMILVPTADSTDDTDYHVRTHVSTAEDQVVECLQLIYDHYVGLIDVPAQDISITGYLVSSPYTAKINNHCLFFFSSRRRHTRFDCDWSSDVCSSD